VFLVSLFKVLSEHPNMTATQVIELVNEKSMLVAPTLGRQHTEYVGGMVPRELDLLSEMGMIDPIPPRLAEAIRGYGMSAIEVTDTSPLSLAASAGEVAGFMRSVEQTRELVNITQDMSLLDPYDSTSPRPAMARINRVRKAGWPRRPDGRQAQGPRAAAGHRAGDPGRARAGRPAKLGRQTVRRRDAAQMTDEERESILGDRQRAYLLKPSIARKLPALPCWPTSWASFAGPTKLASCPVTATAPMS
jgi:hypothetical protein